MNILNTIIGIVALCALGLAIAALVESVKKKDGYIPPSGFMMPGKSVVCDCTYCPGGTVNALPGTVCRSGAVSCQDVAQCNFQQTLPR